MRIAPRPTAVAATTPASLIHYGDKVVVGAELSLPLGAPPPPQRASQAATAATSPVLVVLLRCDGALCVRRASAASSLGVGDDLFVVSPPTVTIWGGDAAGADVASSTSTRTAAHSECPVSRTSVACREVAARAGVFHLWQCPRVAFPPASTVAVRVVAVPSRQHHCGEAEGEEEPVTAAAASSSVQVTWLVFGAGSSSSGSGGCTAMVSVTVVVAHPSAGRGDDSVAFGCCDGVAWEYVAGQTETLCAPGGRPPRSHHHKDAFVVADGGGDGGDDASAAAGEFAADFVAVSDDQVVQSPTVLLGAAPLQQPQPQQQAFPASAVLSPTARSAAAAVAAAESALGEGAGVFSHADVMRLATAASPLVKGRAPTFVGMRAEASFARMAALVQSL